MINAHSLFYESGTHKKLHYSAEKGKMSLKNTLTTHHSSKMSCYRPNIILMEKEGMVKKNGEKGTKITFIRNSSDLYEEYIKESKKTEILSNGKYKWTLVPCGNCQGCKSDRRREWATRIEQEAKYYEHNYYITLTYNDENLKIPKYIVDEKEEKAYFNNGTWKGTLVKEDVQRFIKSIRKYFERDYNHTGTKYYLCGEYGGLGRPHYHMILLNCPNIPLTITGKNAKNQPYYTNERIANIWGKGFITIGRVTWDSITYVAGYVNKKMYGENARKEYLKKGQLPEFALMSQGIGKRYLEENFRKIYENDEIINSKGKSIKPPRYYDRLMTEKNEELIKEIKNKRAEISENETWKKLSKTSKGLAEQLKTEEDYALDSQKKYNRGRIE